MRSVTGLLWDDSSETVGPSATRNVPFGAFAGDSFATVDTGVDERGFITFHETGLYLVNYQLQMSVGWTNFTTAPAGMLEAGAALMYAEHAPI